ncbi:MAG: spoIIIJ-associated protein [Parcubacteria group bacterium Licking1014_17]|nr:MAG: spoIIIJ-associated protein [Parcubacteria group bacterium Licking1014_17]
MDNAEKREKIISVAREIIKFIGVDAEINWLEEGYVAKTPIISIESLSGSGVLIGKKGQNLEALEHLIKLAAAKSLENEIFPFIVDVNKYRKSQISHIASTAREVAVRVARNNRAEFLSPMSAYERRIVHTELSSFKGVGTESVGKDPNRRVIIKPQTNII